MVEEIITVIVEKAYPPRFKEEEKESLWEYLTR